MLYQLLHNECERYVECIKTKQEYRHLFQKNNTQYIEFLTKYGEMINELLMRYTSYYEKSEWKETIESIKIKDIKPIYSLINNWYQVNKSFEAFKNIQKSDVVIENPIKEHLICSLLDPESDAKSFNFKQALLVVRLTTTPDVAKKISDFITTTEHLNEKIANAKALTKKLKQQKRKDQTKKRIKLPQRKKQSLTKI